jgi:ribonucleoside-triphosphate reductase
MHVADAVLSGGIRRSACAVIFDKDDEDMLNAKVGNWLQENPQRARSNNSVLLLRDEITQEEFEAIIKRTREWGEPGFVFADNPHVLFNPCFEVSFIPVTDDGVCGVQFCNLTTVNGSKVETEEGFYDAVRAATIIGTLQATYTDFKYLSHIAKKLTDEEALLGVSITAMMDKPDIILDPRIQRQAAEIAVETNRVWAAKLGINQAARVCVLKPEGTSSLAVGTMASGIHPAHARWMFRRVHANKMDNVYQYFKSYMPDLTEESVWSANGTDDIITFPIHVPEGAMVKADLKALDHLDIIKSTQQNWVVPGTTMVNKKPIEHNVSCTVIVQEDEWPSVTDYLYSNRRNFAAVSLLAASGDKDYAQAPNEAVSTEEDVRKFVKLMNAVIPLNYTYMVEHEDGTSLMQEASCAGPEGCEVK